MKRIDKQICKIVRKVSWFKNIHNHNIKIINIIITKLTFMVRRPIPVQIIIIYVLSSIRLKGNGVTNWDRILILSVYSSTRITSSIFYGFHI